MNGAGQAQAVPAGYRAVDVDLFATRSVVYTGLSGGQNAAVTAGGDLNLPHVGWLRPSLEVRVTVPYDRGQVDTQRSVLGGFRGSYGVGRFHPYVDVLAGYGTLSFNGPYTTLDGGYVSGRFGSTIVSPGVGIQVDLGRNLSALGDVQMQYWKIPASLSGHLFAKPVSVGLVYRFGWRRLRSGDGR